VSFPADELDEIRAEAVELLTANGKVSKFTSASDGAGGTIESWVTGAAIPCRLAPLGSSPAGRTADRLDERTTHVVTLPAETDVTTDDRVEVEGHTYTVTARRHRDEATTFVVRVEVMEVD